MGRIACPRVWTRDAPGGDALTVKWVPAYP